MKQIYELTLELARQGMEYTQISHEINNKYQHISQSIVNKAILRAQGRVMNQTKMNSNNNDYKPSKTTAPKSPGS